MSDEESVSEWIEGLKAGRESAATQLWNRFYTRLLALARRRLGDAPRRAADEEDVVVSAMESFFRRAQEGQFPVLRDRDDLWHLLFKIIDRKAVDLRRGQGRRKRGGGKVRGESALRGPPGDSHEQGGLEQVAGPEPTPEFEVAVSESLGHLLGLLDDELRQIALLKLEGHTNTEIAEIIGRSLPTVERRLKLIRDLWSEEPP
jgi:RNA polymerase sigma factor (sigma-70 family)